MIKQAEISGGVPQLQEPKSIFEKLSLKLRKDLLNDVRSGGNPAWRLRIYGDTAKLGHIKRTIQSSFGDNYAMVSFTHEKGGKVARVHEYGMNIVKTDRMRKAMWANIKKHDPAFVWNGVRKPILTIPGRSATSGLFARKEEYVKFVGQELIITKTVPL